MNFGLTIERDTINPSIANPQSNNRQPITQAP
jgi:hypothetical protein